MVLLIWSCLQVTNLTNTTSDTTLEEVLEILVHETNSSKGLKEAETLTDAELTILTTALDTTASILEEFTNVTDQMTNVKYYVN